MNKQAKTSSMILGIAFVWFTTHFGGGFASGAQIYTYYVKYGIWCLLMPVLAMLYNAVFFAYCLRFARKHEVYDYRSYNNAFYGRFAPIFSNLFEVLYLCVMCVAPAVAFATGGATLSTLTGLPYLLCTLLIGAFHFHRGDFRHGSCAQGRFGFVRLHHRRSAGRVHSEHYRGLRRHCTDRARDDRTACAVRQGAVCSISVRHLPARQCRGVCSARQVV